MFLFFFKELFYKSNLLRDFSRRLAALAPQLAAPKPHWSFLRNFDSSKNGTSELRYLSDLATLARMMMHFFVLSPILNLCARNDPLGYLSIIQIRILCDSNHRRRCYGGTTLLHKYGSAAYVNVAMQPMQGSKICLGHQIL